MIYKPDVLILGTPANVSSHEVARRLYLNGAAYHYVDLQEFDHRGVEIRYVSGSPCSRIEFLYTRDDLTVSTESLKSAYFRETAPLASLDQLSPYRLSRLEPLESVAFHWRQMTQFCYSVLEFLARRCFCLYPLAASDHLERKLLQLNLAQDLGFPVPDTYVGNNLKAMREFVASHGEVISKPFHSQKLRYEDHAYATFTTLITRDDLEHFSETRYPVVLQEAIRPKRDIRIAVVGKKVFATEIEIEGARKAESIVDFRHYEIVGALGSSRRARFHSHQLPAMVRDRCLAYMRAGGLQYSVMDLLLIPTGDYVFVECNAKGMHGEVERGGHDVIGAIAELLMDPESNKLA